MGGWRGGLLYQRRDHRVSLRYTPCSTDNVQVLGQFTRPDFHVVPSISVAVVFCGWLLCYCTVPREIFCNKIALLIVYMLIFWGSCALRAAYLMPCWLVALGTSIGGVGNWGRWRKFLRLNGSSVFVSPFLRR